MSEWNLFKIDIWWKAVLAIGILATICSSIFPIEFFQRKHLFGLGIGMIIIGLGFWKSYKVFSQFYLNGILSWKDYKYDFVSITLIVFGIIMVIYFGYFILKSLI